MKIGNIQAYIWLSKVVRISYLENKVIFKSFQMGEIQIYLDILVILFTYMSKNLFSLN